MTSINYMKTKSLKILAENNDLLTLYINNSRNSSKYEHCSPHKI